MAKYTKKDLEQLNKSYKKIFKESGCRILSKQEMDKISASISLLSSDDRKIIEAAQNGDYSQFNDASPLVRNYIGTLSWNKFTTEQNLSQSQLSLNNEQARQYIQDHVLDAGFRVGLSAMKHTFPDNNNLKELDEYANECMLINTLSTPSRKNVKALEDSIGQKATQRELEKKCSQTSCFCKNIIFSSIG